MNFGQHHHIHHHIKDQAKFDILHSKKYVRILDKCVLVIGFLGPLFTWPQIWQLYTVKDAQGLSLFTWSSWLVFTIFWLIYGLAHKEKPLIVANGIGVVNLILVVTGIIIFG